MATRKQTLVSPPPRTSLTSSPAILAVRSSTFATVSLPSYPVTSSPFSSSPTLSDTHQESSASPDFFDDLEYNEDMDPDLYRIDTVAALDYRIDHDHPRSLQANRVIISASPSPPPSRDRKTWVVFRGRTPGIYEDSLCAAMQTQGHSDAFQRVFPDPDAAKTAWIAYTRDQTYPDYGKGPWVVFLGRRPGVFIKVSELEACVKGYEGTIFRSCSSVAEGKIKFQIFVERVAQMFTGPDIFAGVEGLMSQQLEEGDLRGTMPATRLIAPVPVVPISSPPAPAPPVAESSRTASKRNASGALPAPLSQRLKVTRPGDGWYVAHNAALPGVYYGVSALRSAGPEPGGFHCARDQKSADQLFHDLTINGAIVWADVGK